MSDISKSLNKPWNGTRILFHIVSNPDYCNTVLPLLPEKYFENKYERTLLEYIKAYMDRAKKKEINIGVFNDAIQKFYEKSGDENYIAIKNKITKYYEEEYDKIDLQILIEETEKFIRNVAIEIEVKDMIVYHQSAKDEVSEEKMYEHIAKMSDAYGFKLDRHIGHDYIDGLNDRLKYYETAFENGIRCDLRSINSVCGQAGFIRKTLNVFLAPPHTGKCVTEDTIITVRNKKTDEVMKITIGELYNMMKNRS